MEVKRLNAIASIWHEKKAGIFVLGHYLLLEAHSFLLVELCSWKTVHILGQIMSADKYLCIFLCQIEAIVYLLGPSCIKGVYTLQWINCYLVDDCKQNVLRCSPDSDLFSG